jgi:hypothetical protein
MASCWVLLRASAHPPKPPPLVELQRNPLGLRFFLSAFRQYEWCGAVYRLAHHASRGDAFKSDYQIRTSAHPLAGFGWHPSGDAAEYMAATVMQARIVPAGRAGAGGLLYSLTMVLIAQHGCASSKPATGSGTGRDHAAVRNGAHCGCAAIASGHRQPVPAGPIP